MDEWPGVTGSGPRVLPAYGREPRTGVAVGGPVSGGCRTHTTRTRVEYMCVRLALLGTCLLLARGAGAVVLHFAKPKGARTCGSCTSCSQIDENVV